MQFPASESILYLAHSIVTRVCSSVLCLGCLLYEWGACLVVRGADSDFSELRGRWALCLSQAFSTPLLCPLLLVSGPLAFFRQRVPARFLPGYSYFQTIVSVAFSSSAKAALLHTADSSCLSPTHQTESELRRAYQCSDSGTNSDSGEQKFLYGPTSWNPVARLHFAGFLLVF